MITVAELKRELDKFPDEAFLCPYEGEITGLVVLPVGCTGYSPQSGFIHMPADASRRPSSTVPISKVMK